MTFTDWFSGLGAVLIGCIVSFVLGGTVGYKLGFRAGKNQQIQNAGDNANQMQVGEIHYGNESKQDRG